MIKSTDVINAQRKDIVYTIDATTGKFVKSSQTEYYPQDYPISYWGTNGTEIWNGTETKIEKTHPTYTITQVRPNYGDFNGTTSAQTCKY